MERLGEARTRTLELIDRSTTSSSTASTRRSSARWPGTSVTSPTSRSSGWCRRSAVASRCTASSAASTTRSRTRARRRGELPILRDAELRSYLADVRERTLEVLDEVDLSADAEDPLLREGFVYEMLLAHELQHNETMLQLLQLVGGYENDDFDLGPSAVRGVGSRDDRGRRGRARDRRPRAAALPTTTSALATRLSSPRSKSIELQ